MIGAKHEQYLTMGVAIMSWSIFAASWVIPEAWLNPKSAGLPPSIDVDRTVPSTGFIAGGMLSVVALFSCVYYWIHQIRGPIIWFAGAISGVYAMLFLVYLGSLVSLFFSRRLSPVFEWFVYWLK